jgi:hypothetical protein
MIFLLNVHHKYIKIMQNLNSVNCDGIGGNIIRKLRQKFLFCSLKSCTSVWHENLRELEACFHSFVTLSLDST